ncbi:GHKL domain-containing protein [Aliivibrio fischeri]|uniref:ATP-binding protein n=1 Tax=Aliivibrio fischeri TaxID=668 RepID=UPI0012D9683C|nr:sensor histidine kinase [Aliivibrio fischeri]MUK61076.1 GHKL domain-containing protein [Aliivibrio fischeri]MUK68560.1 GHKL domain-containing protein [Aliivibrio fischeri]MUK73140.1 GHKL domain-containing protein [Aliivibrio fischeri]MUK76045.1 GHKL domain-containing protein [Aliivibrio fischeri]MUL20944.1 GHKL domain-containing protein [Aliivibrio fischeri]
MSWRNLSFRRRLLSVMTISGIGKLLILSLCAFLYIKHWESQDSGEKALGIARFISQSPLVIKAVEQNAPRLIENKIERLRSSIGAAFIVVGNIDGIRIAHPIKERIGKPMQGGDNQQALQFGQSYVSYAKGSLGKSVRGKTPIFDLDGNIIGVVSVGYLLTSIDTKVSHFLGFFLGMAVLVIFANAIIANFIARRFQKSIFGFEPEAFGRLYKEQQVTLSTLREGVLSIDADGKLRSINNSACEILGIDANIAINKPFVQVLPDSDLTKLLVTHKSEHDIELLLNGQAVIANRELIQMDGKVIGAVSSFRRKDEISELTSQLSQVKQYADLLRSQTHEHRNKLNTISGLIQLGKIEEVQQIIGQESLRYQKLIEFLRESVSEPMIAGVLLGKSERARELGLTLDIEEGTQLDTLPEHIRAEDIVTIIGNLIDNAFDATLTKQELPYSPVIVSITDIGQEVIIEVEDKGCGLPDSLTLEQLTQKGVSTKSDHGRGVGLHLIHQLVEQYRGELTVSSEIETGTVMTIYLPKKLS